MTFNIDRAVDVLAHIEIGRASDEDFRWDQATWASLTVPQAGSAPEIIVDTITGVPLGTVSCGAAFCAAGWAATLANVGLRWDNHGTDGEGNAVYTADYTVTGESVWQFAVDWLGIPRPTDGEETDGYVEGSDERWDYDEDMPRLFDAGNSIDEMYEYVLAYAVDVDPSMSEMDLRARVQQRRDKIEESRLALRNRLAAPFEPNA